MFEVFALAFTLTGLAYLAVFLVVIGALTALVENDKPLIATASVVVAALGFQFLTDIKPLSMIVENPLSLLFYTGLYIAAGVVYGGFRWYRYLLSAASAFAEQSRGWLVSRGLKVESLTPKQHKEMVTDITYVVVGRGKTLYPSPLIREHKSRVLTWMAYWPLSGAYMLLDDLVIGLWRTLRNIFNWAYDQVADLLQSMSDRVFAKFRVDFTPKAESSQDVSG